MAFVENLSLFHADFGVDATLAGQAVRVIFDARHDEAFDMAMSTTQPQAALPTADAAHAVQGDTLTIGAQNYRVTNIQPDGTGWTVLRLQETA